MNGPMNGWFRAILILVIAFILISVGTSYLETNYSGFTEEELTLDEGD